LQKQGVKPEQLVGICAERSMEMIVGILGVLKAGGAASCSRLEYRASCALSGRVWREAR